MDKFLSNGTNINTLRHQDLGNGKVRVELTCGRCGGSGSYSYCQMYGTTCFGCNGGGTVVAERRTYTAKQIASKEAAKQRKADAEQAAREAKAQAKVDAFTAAMESDPELAKAYQCGHKIAANIQDKHRQWGSISEAQRKLVLKLAADETAKADIPAIEEGRRTVEGEVLGLKEVHRMYDTVMKARVKEAAGTVVYCSVPWSIEVAVNSVYDLVGRVIRFDAKVTRSDNDPTFGFGSRPTKGWIVDDK
jgi:hypothetical protein